MQKNLQNISTHVQMSIANYGKITCNQICRLCHESSKGLLILILISQL